MFRHDMSGFQGVLPNPDGTFPDERLRKAFAETEERRAVSGRPDLPPDVWISFSSSSLPERSG
jgi:hypothetical protein